MRNELQQLDGRLKYVTTDFSDLTWSTMRRRSNNRARNRPGGPRRHGVCVSVTAVQLLLGLWVGVGMHVVHPLVHRGHWFVPTDGLAATAKPVSGCSHGCFHRHESEHDNVRADSHAQAFGAAMATSTHSESTHVFKGPCPICSFLGKTGKWTHSASPLALAHAESMEQRPPDHGPYVLRSLYLAGTKARAPPSLFTFPG